MFHNTLRPVIDAVYKNGSFKPKEPLLKQRCGTPDCELKDPELLDL